MIKIKDILARLDATGLNDLELGKQLGISNSTIGKWRNGGNASQGTLLLVKQWLDKHYPVDTFLQELDEMDARAEGLMEEMLKLQENIQMMGQELAKITAEFSKINKARHNITHAHDNE